MKQEHVIIILLLVMIGLIWLVHTPICWFAGTYTSYPFTLADAFRHTEASDSAHLANLETFYDVAMEMGLDFFVCQGSALGLIRSGKLVEGDSDVDVGVYAIDVPRLKNTIGILTSSYGFRVWRNAPLSIMRSGSYIDIDITERGQPCMAVLWPTPCDDHINTLEPFQYVQYRSRRYKVPSHEYLRYLYGPNWQVPNPGFKSCMVDRGGHSMVYIWWQYIRKTITSRLQNDIR